MPTPHRRRKRRQPTAISILSFNRCSRNGTSSRAATSPNSARRYRRESKDIHSQGGSKNRAHPACTNFFSERNLYVGARGIHGVTSSIDALAENLVSRGEA